MRPVIYLLEGADGTGKTSFVERNADELRLRGQEVRTIHNGPEDAQLPGSLFRHYRAQLLDAIDFRDQGISTFIDRSYLSEWVYGLTYRDHSKVTYRQVNELDALAARAEFVVIGFTAAPKTRRERIEERGERWDTGQFHIAERYRVHFQRPNSPWTIVDSTSTLVTL